MKQVLFSLIMMLTSGVAHARVCSEGLFADSSLVQASRRERALFQSRTLVRKNRFFTIQAATDRDRMKILNFIEKVRLNYGMQTDRSLKPGSVDADLARLSEIYDGDTGQFLVVKNELGAIVATAAYAGLPTPGFQCELRKVYVDESAQGMGLGRLLVSWLATEAGERGYREMLLKTHQTMGSAQSLYKSLDFSEIPSWPVKTNSKANLYMRKAL